MLLYFSMFSVSKAHFLSGGVVTIGLRRSYEDRLRQIQLSKDYPWPKSNL